MADRRDVAAKAAATRKLLGPRYPLSKETVRLPGEFAGTVAKHRRTSGYRPSGHPTRDAT